MLKEALASWKKRHPQHLNAVSTFGWIGKEGYGFYFDGVCHAGLTSPKGYIKYDREGVSTENIGEYISVVSGIQKNETTLVDEHPEMERTFLEWLMFHSPFKKGLLSDTVANALDYRILLGNPDAPSNLMGGALMSTRIFNEHPASLHMWWEFVKNGLHPSIAFPFAHRLYIQEGLVREHIPSHTGCFNGGMVNKSYLLNFLQEKPSELGVPYRESAVSSIQTFRLWKGVNKDVKGAPAVAEVSALLAKATKSATVSKNPFAKAKAGPYNAAPAPKVADAMELLVPYLSKYKEFF